MNLHPAVERILRHYPSPALRYCIEHWKIGIHVLFHTKRFGVNNEWWSRFDSIVLGESAWKIFWDVITVRPIVINFKAALIRAFSLGFMAPEERVHIIPAVRFLGRFMDLKFLDIHIDRTKRLTGRED